MEKSINDIEPSRYQRPSRAARSMLSAEGESGRFEFKRNAKATDAQVLVAAANWVALEPSRSKVTILVGVDENTDPKTGLVTGEVVGLQGDLHKHVETIQNFCRETHPVPVGLRVIEEGVATSRPFLRVEVRPTFPPHYDTAGRRVVREGSSTRALADEELLAMYLDREAFRFEERFQQTAGHLLDELDAVSDRVQKVGSALANVAEAVEQVHGAAWEAAGEAEESKSTADMLSHDIELLRERADRAPVEVFFQLRYTRVAVWRMFSIDGAFRPTKQTARLADRLKALLEQEIDPHDWVMNSIELAFWERVEIDRRRKGTMAVWSRVIEERRRLERRTTFALLDEIEELRKLSRSATELEPAPYPHNVVFRHSK